MGVPSSTLRSPQHHQPHPRTPLPQFYKPLVVVCRPQVARAVALAAGDQQRSGGCLQQATASPSQHAWARPLAAAPALLFSGKTSLHVCTWFPVHGGAREGRTLLSRSQAALRARGAVTCQEQVQVTRPQLEYCAAATFLPFHTLPVTAADALCLRILPSSPASLCPPPPSPHGV